MLFCHLLRLLPAPVFAAAGAALGRLLFGLRFRRRIVSENLRLALGRELPATELEALCRRFYGNIGLTFLEIGRNFAFKGSEMREQLELAPADRARIETALARGRGVVLVSAHIANWELLAMGMASHGIPAAIVVKKMSSAVSQAMVERQRKKTGLEIIYSGGTIEKMKRSLAEGKVIGFMMDQNTTGQRGIRCNYFGAPAASIRALGAMVRDTGAAVIPICAFRQPGGRHRVHLLAELEYLRDPDALREEWLNAQQYQSALEAMVRIHPEQWLWIHRRWKCRRDPLVAGSEHIENA